MKDSKSRSILAMVVINSDTAIGTGVPTFLASDKAAQEKVASELARVLNGNVYGLSNGVIIITQE